MTTTRMVLMMMMMIFLVGFVAVQACLSGNLCANFQFNIASDSEGEVLNLLSMMKILAKILRTIIQK